MVKNLYLLRHGQALVDYGLDDFDRPLTSVGSAQLKGLGERLKKERFAPNKIYCSPAKRTQQTLNILVDQLDYATPVEYVAGIYEASVKTLFDLVVNADEADSSILIIGHNPAISYLFDYLTDSDHTGMSPGQMMHIRFEDLSWSEVSKGMGFKDVI